MGIQTFPPIEAGGGLKFELISSINLATGTPTSVTFSAIDPKYRALKLVINATYSGTTFTRMRLNGDTGNNYGWAYVGVTKEFNVDSFSAGSTSSNLIRLSNGNGDTEQLQVQINDTNIACHKTGFAFSNDGNATPTNVRTTNYEHFLYASTSTISSITLSTGSGTYTAGTAFLLGSE
jgi:hypothetical protein